jgi:hypothetical protein
MFHSLRSLLTDSSQVSLGRSLPHFTLSTRSRTPLHTGTSGGLLWTWPNHLNHSHNVPGSNGSRNGVEGRYFWVSFTRRGWKWPRVPGSGSTFPGRGSMPSTPFYVTMISTDDESNFPQPMPSDPISYIFVSNNMMQVGNNPVCVSRFT